MNPVCLVTAFGRGQLLARALAASGFDVTTLDFTEAFGPEYDRGPGPFPISIDDPRPSETQWIAELDALPRGLAFWLNDGPVELSGDMAAHFAAQDPAVATLISGQPAADFAEDWLRRFNDQWTAPFHTEAWETATARFPFKRKLGLVPPRREAELFALPRAVACRTIEDIQINGARLLEIAVGAGSVTAIRADQFVWCLSSRETEVLNAQLAPVIFPRGVYRPEWAWCGYEVRAGHGPWLEGLPEYVIAVGDVYLPWTYANAIVLRKLPGDVFRAWVKLPFAGLGDPAERARHAEAVATELERRLSLARWTVSPESFVISPSATVFAGRDRGKAGPPWRNWDWIAPETLPRLDLGARLEREAQALRRIEQWAKDKQKKQGAPRDHALHSP